MSKDVLDKLNAALDKYDQKKSEAKKVAEKKKTEHEMYLENFKEKCDTVIKPTMEEIGAVIESRGHRFEITQEDEHKDRDGITTSAKIQLAIYPDGRRPDHINRDYPCLSFIAGTYDKKTYSHVSTMMPGRGGSSGKRRDYSLESITKDAVQEEIVHIVTTCFGK